MLAGDHSSNRPISNCLVVSKLFERFLARQRSSFLESIQLLSTYLSGFRRSFSTETAITEVLSDQFEAVDRADTAIVVLSDLPTTFNMVVRDILQDCLDTSFSIRDTAINWLRSYFVGRRQQVPSGGSCSASVDVMWGLPQRSVLGPILYYVRCWSTICRRCLRAFSAPICRQQSDPLLQPSQLYFRSVGCGAALHEQRRQLVATPAQLG